MTNAQPASLKRRAAISVLLFTFFLLPLIGVALDRAFSSQAKSAQFAEIEAYSYSLLTVLDVDAGRLMMPVTLTDDQFNLIQSGLYAAVSQQGHLLWTSVSLLGIEVPQRLKEPKAGNRLLATFDINGLRHFAFAITVIYESEGIKYPVTVHVFKSEEEFAARRKHFQDELWYSLGLIMLALFAVQISWLWWVLRPMHYLKREIVAVEKGQQTNLQRAYPKELQQVANRVNRLLQTELNQRERHRNALSDLTHALKTPLAVIRSQGNLNQDAKEQLTLISNIVEHQLKRAQSAGQASWHKGVTILPIVEKLTNTLEKIYRDKNVIIEFDIDDKEQFFGDEADLMEIVGNLCDNACKACKDRVLITAKADNKQLTLAVEDNGPGVPEDKKDSILQRGTRADTYQQGHGIGLAIVRDLVDSYNGNLTIDSSPEFGGARFLMQFTLACK